MVNKTLMNLKYGVIHSQFGFSDGVSIVMKQIEDSLKEHVGVLPINICYLLGKCNDSTHNATCDSMLWDRNSINKTILKDYQQGLDIHFKKRFEEAINYTVKLIRKFVKENEIDVIIAHNTCHPVNFVTSVALSRYYKEEYLKEKIPPKYILWWHDSHLERDFYTHPAKNIKEYILEGLPGPYVDKIVFINSHQVKLAKTYFKKLEKSHHGIYKKMIENHTVIYNTSEKFIRNYDDLQNTIIKKNVIKFKEEFEIKKSLGKTPEDRTLFCLQHTRIVKRKRIDFALKYAFRLLCRLKKRGDYDAVYFMVSGEDSEDGEKAKLIELYNKLCKRYKDTKVILVFSEDIETTIRFIDFPKIFANLDGIATFFSEIEGFGNNLLECLASGLIPVIFKYPIYRLDISPMHFKLISTRQYQITQKLVKESVKLIMNKDKKKKWVNENLNILTEKLANRMISKNLLSLILD